MIFRELNRSQCKTYLIGCSTTHRAVIVDPLDSGVDRYLAMLAYFGCTLEFVIDTHTHADHRTGLWDLRDLTGARAVMHRRAPAPRIDMHVDDGDELQVGELSLRFRHTPGHTLDGVVIILPDRVLTGDTLLIHGTGRSDFPGGSAGDQYDSIQEKLFTLPDDTLVFSGHDYRGHTESTIGDEKRSNPRLAGKTREEYIAFMDNLGLPLPQRIQEALQANQSAIEDESVQFPPLSNLTGIQQLSAAVVHTRVTSGSPPLVLDVREPDEYTGDLGHIAGSRLIPLKELVSHMADLEEFRAREIICVCRAGVRSTTAAAILSGLGFLRVRNLKGGMLDWNDAGLPVER